MPDEDPEKRIAELERQLAEAKAAATQAASGPEAASPTTTPPSQQGPLVYMNGAWVSVGGGEFRPVEGAGAAPSSEAQRQLAALAGDMAAAFQDHLRSGNDWGEEIKNRRGAFNRAVVESGMSAEQVRQVYRQAAVDAQMSGQGFSAGGPVDTRLAEPPRKIPLAFRLAELLPFRWWYIFILFMVATTLGVGLLGLFGQVPLALPIVYAVALAGIYAFQFAGAAKRFTLLRWGQVASVTGTNIASRATYYSGTTWGFAPLPIAHGWQVKRPLYSGPNTKTRIRYTLNGSPGELTVSGREYVDGVVLADSRNPSRALCVTSFAYDLDRDEAGNWIGQIRPRLLLGMAVWSVIVVAWIGLIAGFVQGRVFGFDVGGGSNSSTSSTASVPQGGTLTVGPGSHARTIACNDGHLTLSAPSSTYTVTGHCASLSLTSYSSHLTVDSANTLTVSGYGNTVKLGDCDGCNVTLAQYGNSLDVPGHVATLAVKMYNNIVTVDSADAITVEGYSNTVTYHSGEPQVTNNGYSNIIRQG